MSKNASAIPVPAWASAAGRILLTTLKGPHAASEAIDRNLIAERIYRYGWAYDERDCALFADCFVGDAVWEGNVMGDAPVGPFVGREAIVEWNTGFWKKQSDQRRHIFTNVIVDDLTDSFAAAHAYLLLTSSFHSTMKPVTTGAYRILMVKEVDNWRIKRLTSSFDAAF